MPKLYELAQNYQNVWELVDDDTIDPEIIETTLQAIEGAIEEKAGNIVVFIQSLETDAKAIKEEEKRLANRRKAFENKAKWFKGYLQSQMEKAGINKVKTTTHTIALQNNPPAVLIEDENKIPAKFMTIIPESYVPDKKAIAEAIKAGEEVPGCQLTQGKSLRIR